MTSAWRAWVALWDRREPATAQALVRIAVGLCVVADLVTVWRLDLIEAIWAPPPEGMGWGAAGAPWSVRWLGASADTARALFWTALGASALVTVGAATRLAAVVYVLASAQLAYLAPDGDRGIDAAFRVVMLVLALSSCHARWSIDAWLRARLGRPFPALVPAWPRLLLLVQVCWIYASSGHHKVAPEWGPHGGFTALGNVLADPHFARFGAGWVATIDPITRVATAIVMVFEWLAPLVLLWTWFEVTATRPGRARRLCNRLHLRHTWIAIGVAFHLGIAALLRLGVFPWGMLALYPVLLLPDELTRAEAWITGRGSGGGGDGAVTESGR